VLLARRYNGGIKWRLRSDVRLKQVRELYYPSVESTIPIISSRDTSRSSFSTRFELDAIRWKRARSKLTGRQNVVGWVTIFTVMSRIKSRMHIVNTECKALLFERASGKRENWDTDDWSKLWFGDCTIIENCRWCTDRRLVHDKTCKRVGPWIR